MRVRSNAKGGNSPAPCRNPNSLIRGDRQGKKWEDPRRETNSPANSVSSVFRSPIRNPNVPGCFPFFSPLRAWEIAFIASSQETGSHPGSPFFPLRRMGVATLSGW